MLTTIDSRLVLVTLGLSLGQAIATYLGYVPLVRLRYVAAMATGNLRYGLARIHANAEAIAFYRGEPAERDRLNGLVGAAVRRDLIVTLFRRTVTDMAPLFFGVAWIGVPYLVLAPRLFAGEIDFGTLTQGIAVSLTVSNSAAACSASWLRSRASPRTRSASPKSSSASMRSRRGRRRTGGS